MEYQQIAAACSSSLPSTDPLLRGSWNGAGSGVGGLVFGTLLGPEATGPGWGAAAYGLWCSVPCLFVSGFLAAPITRLTLFLGGCVWGVWFGVVV